ncbi:MAG: hypothetical protein ACLS48_00795 [[Eubacterium] siraeum]
MAEKRMFSKQVLWSDKFIDLPLLHRCCTFSFQCMLTMKGLSTVQDMYAGLRGAVKAI